MKTSIRATTARGPLVVKSIKPVGTGLLVGYARIAKGDDQDNSLQLKALKAVGGYSRKPLQAVVGTDLNRMLDHLRDGDTVVVWKLDRLSRSLKDVPHIMERIAESGAGFRSVTENIDTTTPAGRMMMRMVISFAEFERAMIRERTSAGNPVRTWHACITSANRQSHGLSHSTELPSCNREPPMRRVGEHLHDPERHWRHQRQAFGSKVSL